MLEDLIFTGLKKASEISDSYIKYGIEKECRCECLCPYVKAHYLKENGYTVCVSVQLDSCQELSCDTLKYYLDYDFNNCDVPVVHLIES